MSCKCVAGSLENEWLDSQTNILPTLYKKVDLCIGIGHTEPIFVFKNILLHMRELISYFQAKWTNYVQQGESFENWMICLIC